MAHDNGDATPLLTAGQVGARLNRSADTVRRMWSQGTLPWVRINGRRCTPAAALDQWIAQQADKAMGSVKE